MFPPHKMVPTFLPAKRSRFAEHGRKSGGARAFDDAFLDGDEHGHRALELAFFDQLHLDAQVLAGSGW